MADLFQKNSDTIGLHIRNIFKEGESEESSTTGDFSVVQEKGIRKVLRKIKTYNLDVIISVGYKSPLFRSMRWSGRKNKA